MSSHHVSLDNFDEHAEQRGRQRINSPTSIEACKRHGLEPEDLVVRDLQHFRQKLPDFSDGLIQKRCEEYEIKRRQRLRTVRAEREKIFIENENIEMSIRREKQQMGNRESSLNVVEKERRQLKYADLDPY